METSGIIAIIGALAAAVATIITTVGAEIRRSRRGAVTRHEQTQERLDVLEGVASGTQRTVRTELAQANARIAELEAKLKGRREGQG